MNLPLISSVLLAFALTFLPCRTAPAQSLEGFGFKGGFVSASAFDNLDDLDRRNGLAASAFAEWNLLPTASLVTEVGYAQRGFVETMEERSAPGETIQIVEANTRLDYLTLPVMVKLQRTTSTVTPYLLAGPRLGVLMHRQPGTFEFTTSEWESELAAFYERVAVGGTVGLGLSTGRLLPARLLVEARYDVDISDSLASVPRDTRNHALFIAAGITF